MSRREVQIILGEITELVSALKRNGHHVQQSLVNSIYTINFTWYEFVSRVHLRENQLSSTLSQLCIHCSKVAIQWSRHIEHSIIRPSFTV